MPRTEQPEYAAAVDKLCDFYLPRVLQYASYWVADIETAEKLTLNILRRSFREACGRIADTDSFTIALFTLARQSIARQNGENWPCFKAISTREREVLSLKLGAELSNRCIAAILKTPESGVGTLVAQSLYKLWAGGP